MVNTDFFLKCIHTLSKAHEMLAKSEPNSIEFELYRSACVKEFEIILEQAGKLLKKSLQPFFANAIDADKLFYKDIFRTALKHGCIDLELTENWINYRDLRNKTAHDYGVNFAEETLVILPKFIQDSYELLDAINLLNSKEN
jgi:nucleotidyltransferase substrate binding protein (TIGR01987 family)